MILGWLQHFASSLLLTSFPTFLIFSRTPYQCALQIERRISPIIPHNLFKFRPEFDSDFRTELPLEIIFLILEALAEEVPAKARDLVMVCRAAQRIIDPILYRVVVLKNTDALYCFAYKACKAKGHSFCEKHVKAICITEYNWDPGENASSVETALKYCTGLQSLALAEDFGLSDVPQQFLKGIPSLRRLSGCSWDIGWPDFNAPLLRNLTHLDIKNVSTENLIFPDHSPLTHLSLHCTELDIMNNLQFPDSLIVCIVTLFITHLMRDLPEDWFTNRTYDPRIVVACETGDDFDNLAKFLRRKAPYHFFENGVPQGDFDVCVLAEVICRKGWDSDHHEKDWGHPSKGEPDIWELAEGVVVARHARLTSGEDSDSEFSFFDALFHEMY